MIEEGIQSTVGMLTALSLDVVVLFLWALVYIIAGAVSGRREELSLTLAIYPTLAIMVARPEWEPIRSDAASLACFVAAFILSFLVVRRFIAGSFPYTRLHKYIEMISLGVTGAGAAVAVMVATGALSPIYQLSSTTRWIFENPWSLLLWLLAPLIALLILVRR